MNIHTVFIRAALATAMLGVGLASFDVPHATAGDAAAPPVETREPLHTTLLPTVTVFSDAQGATLESSATVAERDPLPVTLMPTVYVRASLAQRVARRSEAIAARGETDTVVWPTLAPIGHDRAATPPDLRVRSMPR